MDIDYIRFKISTVFNNKKINFFWAVSIQLLRMATNNLTYWFVLKYENKNMATHKQGANMWALSLGRMAHKNQCHLLN